MIRVNIINKSKHALPAYATPQSAGMDLRANIEEAITLKPLERRLIPTGLFIELPVGYEAQIRPRSGLALKRGITVLNTPGTIDAGYRDEIMVIVENIEPPIKDIGYEFDDKGRPIITSIEHGKTYYIGKGERFAQMRLVEVPTVNFYQVQSVDGIGEDRGGGFGSSGKN